MKTLRRDEVQDGHHWFTNGTGSRAKTGVCMYVPVPGTPTDEALVREQEKP